PAIRRISRPMPGVTAFWSTRASIVSNVGIATMHMIQKRQMDCPYGETMSTANPFYRLAV
ncbi:MAG: IS6 family transposase, partial [Burkholderiaceae bacterium]|nr:IS6 family transposase [Burkholderiaceae bacterium]